MNENDEYRIDRIDLSYTSTTNWSEENATSNVGSTFSIGLKQNQNKYNAIVRIYVTKLRHELTVEYKKTDDSTIKNPSKFYQLIDVNCEEYFNGNFESNGTLKENADVTTIGDQRISRDIAGYRFNHAVMSADKKTLTFYYDQLFKVTYDANGGTGNLPTEAEYVAGEEVIVAGKGDLEKTDCTFAGWKKGDEVVNGTFTMPAQDVTLTAMWEENKTPVTPTKPTKAVDAKYFVLLPGRGTPASGKDQGTSYYLPNENNNGGITGLTYLTGYTGGGLTAAGQTAANGSYTNIDSMNGIFNRTGIDDSYLVVPTNLGYFTVGNWTAEGVYSPTSTSKAALSNVLGENFNTKNISIIWYSLKKQFRDGRVVYHVDGYVKDIPVTLTYHDNFTGSSDSYTQNGLKSGETAPIAQNGTVSGSKTFSHAGYVFDGWYDNADCTGTNYAGQTHTMMDNLNLYAKWEPATTLSYTVKYVDKDTKTELARGKVVNGQTFNASVTEDAISIDGYTVVGDASKTITITVGTNEIIFEYAKATQYKIIIHYVDDAQTPTTLQKDTVIEGKYENNSYDVNDKIPARIGDYIKESVPSNVKGTMGKSDVTITVVYTKDVLVDPTAPKTNGPGDNIPDKYQVTINYVSSDTTIGRITGRTQEVLTIYVDKKPASNGTVQANGSTAEATGSRNYFSNWTKEKKDGTQVGANTTLEPLEIKDAEGGKTYTFYANFYHRSGGGGSRPSTPTVTIPDDVPTGLNGTDHYAYIIGYGNNDVRPQNNITRAEVATIFFRLLTDETRTANMTKSNSYNDVKDGDWFCCAVSTLSKMGIIKGYEDGSFKPNDPISRAEFAAIAARFDPDGDKTPATFADVTSHWAKDEISIAANHGWIKGYEDGSFKPDQKITRAETMTLVNRVLNRLPETKDDLHKDMKTWVDNMDETAWYYLAVQEATNSHYFKNKTGTKFEQWTDLRDTRDWSELEK